MKTIKFELQCSNPEGINQYSDAANKATEKADNSKTLRSFMKNHEDAANLHQIAVDKINEKITSLPKGHPDIKDLELQRFGHMRAVENHNNEIKEKENGWEARDESSASGLQASQVPAAEHLCQCAKCSCNFDKSKAKSTDAGCECPNCGTLLDEKGAAKVEDQAAKEIKAEDDGDGDMDAKNATRQPALEAGGPGSGPRKGGGKRPNVGEVHKDWEVKKVDDSGVHIQHRITGGKAIVDHETWAKDFHEADPIVFVRNSKLKASDASPAASLQAGFNGNQHKSAKELAAEHSVAADTASKVAASASKAARNQDPSNKEGLHGSAMTMHTAAKSLHELAAAKHRSAGNEDCAKDHDTAAAGHGDEIQAHKGVIEACGGMAARGNGAAGLEASNPEGINQYSGTGIHPTQAAYAHAKAEHDTIKQRVDDEVSKLPRPAETDNDEEDKKNWMDHYRKQGEIEEKHGLWPAKDRLRVSEDNMMGAAKAHMERQPIYKNSDASTKADLAKVWEKGPRSLNIRPKLVDSAFRLNHGDGVKARNATPAAGLQLDCSACVEAKAAKSILNPIADGIIMYMPSGTHTITPSQNGRPVTVSVAIDASAAEKLETQRAALEAGGKKPFFSVQHSTQIAAFWPAEFFWDTRLDATGSLVEGVWARGEWTRAGREAVEGKDFRTFSPTFFVDAIRNDPNRPVQVVCNDEAKANMGALENDPAFQTISPLWAHDASAPGTPKPKPEGVTTEKLIVMVHDELRASNPDLQDVVTALSFKYDMRVNANDVARALRGEALEAGGPGSGPHPGYAAAKEKAEASSKEAHEDTAKISGEGTSNEHHIAGNLHSQAAFEHRGAAFAAQDDKTMKEHLGTAKEHDQKAQSHYEKASAISGKALPKYPAPSKP